MMRYHLLCRKVVSARVTWVSEWYDTPLALDQAFQARCHQKYWDTVDAGAVEIAPTPRQLTLREPVRHGPPA